MTATETVALGKQLGGQFRNEFRESGDFEKLRQLVTLFPKVNLAYGKDYVKIKARLKFQLAMWLGDNGNQYNTAAREIQGNIANINNPESWQMYQKLMEVILAEFKTQRNNQQQGDNNNDRQRNRRRHN